MVPPIGSTARLDHRPREFDLSDKVRFVIMVFVHLVLGGIALGTIVRAAITKLG